ncbi:MAG: hypothetical protein Q9214_005570, partial [Letrouitia sp. 1 TL-2023]
RGPIRPSQNIRKDRYSPGPAMSTMGAKLRVDNLHYDLSEDDLDSLFTRIGPVISLSLRFDRAGRSLGTAFVTYHSLADAQLAIREFDGANANGQPIRLTLLPSGPSLDVRGRGSASVPRNPFDTAERPSRSLFDRIDDPVYGRESRSRTARSRSRSHSPGRVRRSDTSRPTPNGIDRYVPPPRGTSRARSRSLGRRGEAGGRRRRGGGRDNIGRPRKTQEELDQDMEDYWGPAGQNKEVRAPSGPANGASSVLARNGVVDEDVDMGED